MHAPIPHGTAASRGPVHESERSGRISPADTRTNPAWPGSPVSHRSTQSRMYAMTMPPRKAFRRRQSLAGNSSDPGKQALSFRCARPGTGRHEAQRRQKPADVIPATPEDGVRAHRRIGQGGQRKLLVHEHRQPVSQDQDGHFSRAQERLDDLASRLLNRGAGRSRTEGLEKAGVNPLASREDSSVRRRIGVGLKLSRSGVDRRIIDGCRMPADDEAMPRCGGAERRIELLDRHAVR